MPPEIPQQLNIAEEFVSRPAREHPERTAILGEPSRFSYSEVDEAVNRAANALRECGCEAGERVLIILPDSIEFIGAFFGAAKIGAIAVPVNSMARAADYSYYVKDTGARIAIVHASAIKEFLRIEAAPELRLLAISGEGAEDAVKTPGPVFAEVRKLVWDDTWNQASAQCEAHPTLATDPAFLLYTSGSGGTPKAAIHRHADMVRTSRGYAREVLG
ncbi:MAG: AMP-binding protein, partial [Candidatus Acidiferrales bacterium]